MTVKYRIVLFTALCVSFCMKSASLSQAQTRAYPPIAVNVELVTVPVVVFDNKGAVATNLKKDDFRLLDDGVVQQILYFDRVRTPVSFVILADLSSSMTRKIPFVQEASLSLLNPPDQQGGYHDEFSVLGIGNRARRLVPFTHDQQDLQRRLPLLLVATGESTALFDGIYLGIAIIQQAAANQRRAMIIISDGGDNHSRFNMRETRKFLEEADVPVFAVMAGPSFELPDIFPGSGKKPKGSRAAPQFPNLPFGGSDADYIGPAERRGPHNLSVLTEVTGGGVFTAAHEEDLPRIVRTIGLAVRYQYVLSYIPLRIQGPGAKRIKLGEEDIRHKIHVELYPKDSFKGYSTPYYKHAYRSAE
jgi:Ca-activated chloride channel family protein